MFSKIKQSFNDHTQVWLVSILGFMLLFATAVYWLGFELILKLTPAFFALIFSAIFIFWDETLRKKFMIFSTIFVLGYLIELIGIKTGLVFGHYSYGSVLGFKIFSVPLSIGLVWFVTTFSAWNIVLFAGKIKLWQQIGLGILLIVMFDLLLEQFATTYGFWSWRNGTVPINNYISWVVVSTLFFIAYSIFAKKTTPNIFTASVLPLLSIWLWVMLLVNIF